MRLNWLYIPTYSCNGLSSRYPELILTSILLSLIRQPLAGMVSEFRNITLYFEMMIITG